MKYWLLLALSITSGCSTALFPIDSAFTPKPVELREGVLQPSRSVNQLLVERLTLCNKPPAEQDEYLNRIMISKERGATNGVDEDKLNALLFASCKPARTPGILNQLLAELTAAGTWPEEYAAFFDLIIAGQRAYASVEKVYVDLEKAHTDLKQEFANLQQEHEKTIQGLSEIEAQIEQQTVNNTP